MKTEFLSACDRVLSPCGRIVAPQGLGWVDIPVGLQYAKYLAANSADSTEEKLVNTPVPFFLKSFQAYAQPASVGAVYWRLRFPNGRFFQSQICAVSEEFDFGSFRQVIDPPVECAPGSRFFITLDNLIADAGSDAAITVLLEGVLRFTMKSSSGCAAPVDPMEPWASLAPFTRDPNQNILAPEWRLGDQRYPETPQGYRDRQFIYMVPSSNAISVPCNGQVVANQPLFIGSDTDFVLRGLDFLKTAVGGAAGLLFVRMRDHTGYELTDGFVSASRISSVVFPGLWMKTTGMGGALFFDLMMVDNNNTGSFSVQPCAFGVKRGRV